MAHGRSRLILIPREHGAWAMLVVPYIIGAAAVDGPLTRQLLGLAGVLLLFVSRPPLALLMKRRAIDGGCGDDARTLWLNFSLLVVPGAAIFFWFVLVDGIWQLLLIGAAGLGLFALHGYLTLRRRERSQAAELAGVAMLTLTAPLAVCLATGEAVARLPLILWLMDALYFGASVFYVKMRLKAAARRRRQAAGGARLRHAGSLIAYMILTACLLAALAALGWIPAVAVIAFLPAYIFESWSIAAINTPIGIRTEGFIQAGLALVFTIIMVIAF